MRYIMLTHYGTSADFSDREQAEEIRAEEGADWPIEEGDIASGPGDYLLSDLGWEAYQEGEKVTVLAGRAIGLDRGDEYNPFCAVLLYREEPAEDGEAGLEYPPLE